MHEMSRPERYSSVSNRIADEYNDIIEAEFSSDFRAVLRCSGEEPPDVWMELRTCYDEAQALEILAAEPGWLHGERFYDPTVSIAFKGEEIFIQDFGFGPYVRSREFQWRSIEEPVYSPGETNQPLLMGSDRHRLFDAPREVEAEWMSVDLDYGPERS